MLSRASTRLWERRGQVMRGAVRERGTCSALSLGRRPPVRPRGCAAASPSRALARISSRCERFADPQPSAPQNRDQRTGPIRIRARSGPAHDEDDLLDRRRIGRIALPFVRRRAPRPVPRCRGRGSQPTGDVHQSWLGHDALLLVGPVSGGAHQTGRLHEDKASDRQRSRSSSTAPHTRASARAKT